MSQAFKITFLSILIFSVMVNGQTVQPESSLAFSPSLNEVVTSEIGNSLIQSFRELKYEGFELSETLTYKVYKKGDETFSLNVDKYYLVSKKSYGKLYASLKKSRHVQSADNPGSTTYNFGAIFVFNKGDKIFLGEMTEYDRVSAHGRKKLDNVIKKDIAKKIEVVKIVKSRFKQEFIYNGKSGDTYKFSYREFNDDLARPSFTQEVSYDIKDSNIVGFKELKVEIIEASNTKIKYKILSHFSN